MKNIGGSYGGALTAGLFLQEFVDGAPWVHLDIAGPAVPAADDGYLTKGGTGFGVRTLIELAQHFGAPDRTAMSAVPAAQAVATMSSGAWRCESTDDIDRGTRSASARRTRPGGAIRCVDHRTSATTSFATLGSERRRRYDGAVDQRRPQHATTSPPSSGQAYGSGNLEAREVVRPHVRGRRAASRTTARCTARRRGAARAARESATTAARTPVTPVGGGEHRRPRSRASGRTIRVPEDAKTIQACGRPGEDGRPRAGVTRRLPRESHDRDRRRRAPRASTATAPSSTATSSATTACSSSGPTASRSRTSPPATTPRTASSGTGCSATAGRTSPRTATATTAIYAFDSQ